MELENVWNKCENVLFTREEIIDESIHEKSDIISSDSFFEGKIPSLTFATQESRSHGDRDGRGHGFPSRLKSQDAWASYASAQNGKSLNFLMKSLA